MKENLTLIKNRHTSSEMLKLASKSRKGLKSLPADLRKRANDIIYTKL